MTASAVHPNLSRHSLRRLKLSLDRGWLVCLHCSDCSRITGSVERIELRDRRCRIANPGVLCTEQDVDLDHICEVEILTLMMLRGTRIHARFAEIAPWRGGSIAGSTYAVELTAGTVTAGDSGVILLADGRRRRGTIVAACGQRCHLSLDSTADRHPPGVSVADRGKRSHA